MTPKEKISEELKNLEPSNNFINIVSWNVRGLNDPGKRLMIKNMVHKWRADVYCFQESKLRGDFNVVRFPSEKKNCNRITKAMEDFSDFIEDTELVDPPLIGGSFTWRTRDWHDSTIIREEIKGFYQMNSGGDKAPVPDGFTMAFFIHCWDVVKVEVIAAIQNFHSQGYFEKNFNATFIALIPKKMGATKLKDFRPINLISSVYKIISKILTERLKKVMSKLVDTHQLAFIKGRQIMDAILIANECVDVRKITKIPGILCKLDIEKAYDHLNWDFMWYTLGRIGFGNRWINCLKYCVRTVKFSVLINSTPSGFFPSERGLRQGDPLSLFLFILAMGGLSDMLKTTQSNNMIREEDQPKHLRIIFILFEAVFGLHINWSKSFVYPVNEVPEINRLAGILGEQGLWKDVIISRYAMEDSWTTKEVRSPYGVGLWRTIRNLWPKIWRHSKIDIGNGRKTFFWNDVWVGQNSLKQLHPEIYNLNQQKEATVAEVKDNQ
ncbi:hypothetical protein MTR67_015965 [Solanum verrucosum]|uniref:Reverse transcriptase domain-containing protein n=1 Tax=Solanum verrucosum TaxID=315347 RepID=A0AAF0QHT5_SOLVR|nr:hypothetical protein MTR67_015965 [Solanum verrucosum]